jgi:uncharacterized protein YbaP (TraB family)
MTSTNITIAFDENGQIVQNQSYANLAQTDQNFVQEIVGVFLVRLQMHCRKLAKALALVRQQNPWQL